jgi:hypothetical protein
MFTGVWWRRNKDPKVANTPTNTEETLRKDPST